MNRARVATAALVVFLASGALACIWDTDTIRDELQTHASDFDLIVAQFPHHGKGYYLARVEQAAATLAEKPADIAARNDLAVALLKLGRFDEARAEFARIDELEPGRYETLSNLGVLNKKAGRFADAADFTAKALAIKPEGHLGLGDFYLFMLRWQAALETTPKPTKTYLGYAYTDRPWKRYGGAKTDDERKAIDVRIRALVRSDRTNPDAIFVLGDLLWDQDQLNLAMWAYVRAAELGHPRPDMIQGRIDEIYDHWVRAAHIRRAKTQSVAETVKQIRAWIQECAKWQKIFEKVEGELIAKHGLARVDFATVEKELERRKITRNRPDAVGMLGNGSRSTRGAKSAPNEGKSEEQKSPPPTGGKR